MEGGCGGVMLLSLAWVAEQVAQSLDLGKLRLQLGTQVLDALDCRSFSAITATSEAQTP